MAYTKADTTAKVGFRPYHQTDAFGAAHLSGLGQNHPFKPQAWHLHGVPDMDGLGEYHLNRPFDPWELYSDVHETAGMHGLGYLGAASDHVVAQAADELLSSGQITPAEHAAILEGSMTFQDVLGYDPTDQSTWHSLTDLFREVNQDLQALEHSAQTDPAVAAAIGRELIHKRQQYTDLASEFIRYYTMVMGSAPSGLAGLGIAPIVWVAGAVVFAVGAFSLLYALRDWSKSIDVSKIQAETAHTQAGGDQQLIDQLKRAQTAGDTVTANAILAALKARGTGAVPSGSTEKWLMDNAKWIGLGLGGLIVLGPLSQGLFGKRR